MRFYSSTNNNQFHLQTNRASSPTISPLFPNSSLQHNNNNAGRILMEESPPPPLKCDNQLTITNPQQIQLRFLNPNDYETVKALCEHWFPVEYPEKWFEAITSDSALFSLAASYEGRIIGLIVSELKPAIELGRDDKDLICDSQKSASVAYILSLGVVDEFRRQGIASLLLASLLNHLSTQQCKAVYLHVLTSNESALRFYEKHNFRVHKFLPYYYSIGGRARDGFTYVLYLNGGHAPWEFPDYIQHFCEVTMNELCSIPSWCISQMRKVLHSVVAMIK